MGTRFMLSSICPKQEVGFWYFGVISSRVLSSSLSNYQLKKSELSKFAFTSDSFIPQDRILLPKLLPIDSFIIQQWSTQKSCQNDSFIIQNIHGFICGCCSPTYSILSPVIGKDVKIDWNMIFSLKYTTEFNWPLYMEDRWTQLWLYIWQEEVQITE